MKEFILNNKQLVAIYTSLWLMTTAGLFFVLYYFGAFGYARAITDAAISASLFFLFAPAIWFVIRFADKNSNSGLFAIPASLLAGSLIVLIWLYISKFLVGIALPGDMEYLSVVRQTLPLRAMLGLVLMLVVYLLMQVHLLKQKNIEAQLREMQLEELVRKTELHALKNQLNPHFIYNSLNSISSLTHVNPEKAREMILILSDFLRYTLKQDAMQITTLEKEIENVKLYISMELLRYGDKLKVQLHIPDNSLTQQPIPVMLLQPLVENAIKHGVQSSPGPVTVELCIEDSGGPTITVSVTNPYDGIIARFKGEGVGLENIRNRLRLIYGNGKLLTITTTPTVFKAAIMLPKTQFYG